MSGGAELADELHREHEEYSLNRDQRQAQANIFAILLRNGYSLEPTGVQGHYAIRWVNDEGFTIEVGELAEASAL